MQAMLSAMTLAAERSTNTVSLDMIVSAAIAMYRSSPAAGPNLNLLGASRELTA